MFSGFRNVRRYFVELPQQLRLAYCLLRDPRVPAYTKVAFGAGLGILISPIIDLPDDLPLLGKIDAVAIILLTTRLFISACPSDIVLDLEQAIIEQRSVFDSDLHRGEELAMRLWDRFRPSERHIPGTALTGSRQPVGSA